VRLEEVFMEYMAYKLQGREFNLTPLMNDISDLLETLFCIVHRK
jgi:hypothetical protein